MNHQLTPSEALLQECKKDTPSLEEIKRLIDKGADPREENRYNQTYLHVLSANDHLSLEILLFLISQGVDPKAKDKGGNTCMHWLSIQKNPPVNLLRYLIEEQGLHVNDKNEMGRTVMDLHCASDHLSEEVMNLFIEKGVDLNNQDFHKDTCLDKLLRRQLAELIYSKKAIKLVLKQGADFSKLARYSCMLFLINDPQLSLMLLLQGKFPHLTYSFPRKTPLYYLAEEKAQINPRLWELLHQELLGTLCDEERRFLLERLPVSRLVEKRIITFALAVKLSPLFKTNKPLKLPKYLFKNIVSEAFPPQIEFLILCVPDTSLQLALNQVIKSLRTKKLREECIKEKPSLDEIKRLIHKGVNPKEKDGDKNSYLHRLSTLKNPPIVVLKYFIEEQKLQVNDKNSRDQTSMDLLCMCSEPNLEVIKLFLRHGAILSSPNKVTGTFWKLFQEKLSETLSVDEKRLFLTQNFLYFSESIQQRIRTVGLSLKAAPLFFEKKHLKLPRFHLQKILLNSAIANNEIAILLLLILYAPKLKVEQAFSYAEKYSVLEQNQEIENLNQLGLKAF